MSKSSISQVQLSDYASSLEEINLPAKLAAKLAGRTASVRVLPEEKPATRRVEPDDFPLLIDPQGNHWNDYRPVRVLYTDPEGKVWRFPRGWLQGPPQGAPSCPAQVTQAFTLVEKLHMPSDWDLWEVNIPWSQAFRAGGKETEISVYFVPNTTVSVLWTDAELRVWRLPHCWRRRRVVLPAVVTLGREGVPSDIAPRFAGKVVTVNYHRGSLCCYPEHYRFRDEHGNRWPVRIADCRFLGYGDRPEMSPEEAVFEAKAKEASVT